MQVLTDMDTKNAQHMDAGNTQDAAVISFHCAFHMHAGAHRCGHKKCTAYGCWKYTGRCRYQFPLCFPYAFHMLSICVQVLTDVDTKNAQAAEKSATASAANDAALIALTARLTDSDAQVCVCVCAYTRTQMCPYCSMPARVCAGIL